MKGMIGVLQEFQRSPRTEAVDDRLQQFERRELIARALQKQHRDCDVGEMCGALWLTGAISDAANLGFHVSSFKAAFVGGLVVTVVSFVLSLMVGSDSKKQSK